MQFLEELDGDPLKVIRFIESRILNFDPEGGFSRIDTILNLLGPLYFDINRNGIEASQLDWFQSFLGEFLSSEAGKRGLDTFMDQCDRYAEYGPTGGYQSACEMRSILQILNDYFVPWERIGLRFLVEDIAQIDEVLLEVADQAPPPLEHEFPEWAPESHWWWSPTQRGMSAEEREARLEHDHWYARYGR